MKLLSSWKAYNKMSSKFEMEEEKSNQKKEPELVFTKDGPELPSQAVVLPQPDRVQRQQPQLLASPHVFLE